MGCALELRDSWHCALTASDAAIPAASDASWAPTALPYAPLVSVATAVWFQATLSATEMSNDFRYQLRLRLAGESIAVWIDDQAVESVAQLPGEATLDCTSLLSGGDQRLIIRVSGASGPVGLVSEPMFGPTARLSVSWWDEEGRAIVPVRAHVRRDAQEICIQTDLCLRNDYGIAQECTVRQEVVDEQDEVVADYSSDTLSLDEKSIVRHSTEWSLEALPEWWPSRPTRYRLRTAVVRPDGQADVWESPLASASYGVSDGRLHVNGRVLFWRGVRADFCYPELGRSISLMALEREVDLIRSCGFTGIVMQDVDLAILDACEAAGVCVLIEVEGEEHSGARGLVESVLGYSCVIGFLASNREMLTEPLAGLGLLDRFARLTPESVIAYRLEPSREADVLEGIGTTYQRYQRGVGATVLQEQVDLCRVLHDRHYKTGQAGDLYSTFADRDSAAEGPVGVVDAYRNRKPVSWFYQSQLTPAEQGPFVWIADEWVPGAERRVLVFSNCRVVTLTLNGQVVDAIKADEGDGNDHLPFAPFTFEVPEFMRGVLKAIGYVDDRPVAEHERVTPLDPSVLFIEIDDGGRALVADGVDAVFVRASIRDDVGNLVPDSLQEVKFTIEGAGRLVGETPTSAEAGVASILIQARGEAGEIRVTALAPGLQEAMYRFVSVVG